MQSQLKTILKMCCIVYKQILNKYDLNFEIYWYVCIFVSYSLINSDIRCNGNV